MKTRILSFLFETCPKTGRLLGPRRGIWRRRVLWPVACIFALAWVLARVLPKPSRSSYPCVRAAAPLAASYFGYLLGFGLAGALLRKARILAGKTRHVAALGVALLAGAAVVAGYQAFTPPGAAADVDQGRPVGAFAPEAANAPVGTARGIKPGRVAWAHDPAAAHWNGTGNWDADTQNDQAKINAMLDGVVKSVGNQPSVALAWNAIFHAYNNANGRGDVGYKPGEKFAIKINLNNRGNGTSIDQSPQLAYALLNQLTKEVGAAPGDITFYDNMRPASGGNHIKAYCNSFTGVQYIGNDNANRQNNALAFSGGGIGASPTNLPKALMDATYLVNMAVLKRHTSEGSAKGWDTSYGNTGVTLCGKNHCGTTSDCAALHHDLRDWNEAGASYNPLVDLMASKAVGQKTVLFVIDGLYSGNRYDSGPQKWNLVPFKGAWPSSVFASQDGVAIDSVAIDFLHAEWWLAAHADNYLHEAAQIGNAPSGTSYKPDGAAVTGSLGVHEHWNNATSKQYSRNLDPVNGKGIELVQVGGPCSDGIKNGAETDIDCGGGTCAQCAVGKTCAASSDCVNGACVSGTCAGGTVAAGGAVGAGGTAGAGGVVGSGGASGKGGTPGAGGLMSAGGQAGSGYTTDTGGATGGSTWGAGTGGSHGSSSVPGNGGSSGSSTEPSRNAPSSSGGGSCSVTQGRASLVWGVLPVALLALRHRRRKPIRG